MQKRFAILAIAVVALALVTIGGLIYLNTKSVPTTNPTVTNYPSCVAAGGIVETSLPAHCTTADGRSFTQTEPTNFDECVSMGYPVLESYPRQCGTQGGKTFYEEVDSLNRLETLSEGTFGLSKPSERVITTQAEFDKLWKELQNQTSQQLKKPGIDFSTHVVVAVFSGTRGNGGHSTRITDIVQKGDIYQIHVLQTVPGDNCVTTQALTFPHHVVAWRFVPAGVNPTLYRGAFREDNVEFVTKTVVNNCHPD